MCTLYRRSARLAALLFCLCVVFLLAVGSPAGALADSLDNCACSSAYQGWYQVTSGNGLWLHSAHDYGVSSNIILLPANAWVWMSKKATNATYAHVTYQYTYYGIASANYLKKAASYTVTLNDNGGYGGEGSFTVWKGVPDEFDWVRVPSRENYTFTGYYSGGTQVYGANGWANYDSGFWSGTAWNYDGSITLTAGWQSNTVPVTSVTMSEMLTAATVGETVTLTAEVAPSNATYKSLTWTSSDPSVATVSNGRVTAIAPGYSTITATAQDGSGCSDFCIFTVYPSVEKLTLNRNSVKLSAYAPFNRTQFLPTLEPLANVNVLWESSDPTVAVVSDTGLVTAVREGRAVITASVRNGPSDSAVVNVVSGFQTVTLPDNLTEIAAEAFAGTGMEAVMIPKSVESVGSRAFADNPSLRFVFVPRSIYALYSDAFENDPNLTMICGWDGPFVDGVPSVYDDDAAFIPVRTISMPASMTLTQDDQAVLELTFQPLFSSNQGVIWETSDPSIAVVDDYGCVTAVGLGTARITATAVDGSGTSAGCTVTVVMPNVSVSALEENFFLADNDVSVNVQLQIAGVPSRSSVTALGYELYDQQGNPLAVFSEPVESAGLYFRAFAIGRSMRGLIMPSTTYRIRYLAVVRGNTYYSGFSEFTTLAPVPRLVMDQESLILTEGDRASLNAIIYNHEPDEIIWSSSNTSVAHVVDGEVTARSPGTATITARLLNDASLKASCTVTVESLVITAKSVTLSESYAEVEMGQTKTLNASVYPADAVDAYITWSVSDPSVISVSNGVITPLAVGQSSVTAAVSGKPHISASCAITVKVPTITGVSLSNTGLTMTPYGEYALRAFVQPSTASQDVLWTSSDSSVATVDSTGRVTALKGGTAVITAASGIDPGRTASCTVTVKQDVSFYEYSTSGVSSTTAYISVKLSKASSSYTYPTYGVRILNADGSVYTSWSASNPYPSTTTRITFEPLSNDSGGCNIILNPGTGYYWQIFVTCNGLTYYSAKTWFQTLEASAVTLPTSVSASYASGPYYQKLLDAYSKSYSSQAEKFVAIALSQKGYKAGGSLNELSGNGPGDNNHKYTEYYSHFRPTGAYDWCAYFIAWCARMADIPTSIIPTKAYASQYSSFGTVHRIWSDDFTTYRGDYKPQVGDLVMSTPYCEVKISPNTICGKHYNEWNTASHVAIVAYVYPERTASGAWKFITIERGQNNTVQSYTVTDKKTRMEQYTCTDPDHGHLKYYIEKQPAKQFNYFVHPNWSW